MNGWGGFLALVLLVLLVLGIIRIIARPDPGDICLSSQKGVTKFFDTGRIVECDGKVWVVKNGTPP